MSQLTLEPLDRPFIATVAVPGSKSLTNRALVLAALAEGECEISNVLFAEDTLVMLESLARLGFAPGIDSGKRIVRLAGRGGKVPAAGADLFCGNSGTTIRFLAAFCALGRGDFNLDGIARMRQRPIGALVDLLRALGVRVDYPINDGFPPLVVHADRLPGGLARLASAPSSQFLSAVLQIAPYARNEVRIDLLTPQTSWPYVAMTMRLMDQFGHTPHLVRDADTGDPKQIIIPQGSYQPTQYAVEPDASNATYFMGIAAIHPGSRITVPGLGRESLQGDVGFADVLRKMGASVELGANAITVTGPQRLQGIDADLSSMPDTAQTLAVLALFAEGKTTIRGLHTLRVKETDRIAALAAELNKLGATVEVHGDDLHIAPPPRLLPVTIDTYDDHRMAMSFAMAATKSPGITIRDPACVSKTYPEFFDDLRRINPKSEI